MSRSRQKNWCQNHHWQRYGSFVVCYLWHPLEALHHEPEPSKGLDKSSVSRVWSFVSKVEIGFEAIQSGRVWFLVMYAMNWSTVSFSSLELEFYTFGISSFVVNPTTYAFYMDPHPLYEFSVLKRKRAFIWLINFTYNLNVILFIWTRIKQFQIRYRK